MATWRIAAAQIDCRLGDKYANLETVRSTLAMAATQDARLVVFPECALTGYCFESKTAAWPHAESLPGPTSEALASDCRRLGVWVVVGMLERDDRSEALYNACALIGPQGLRAGYRKIHRPCLGVDRFVTPGERPFAVHDLGGLRVGMSICYDGSFPESTRVLTLLGADLVVLPTNWTTGARNTAQYVVPARAMENHIYYAAVNRVGAERGFQFIGQSQIADCTGDLLTAKAGNTAEILYADIDPARARAKQIVKIPGVYEVNRVADRRPEMYGLLCEPRG
jgi:predicted amidohydrolase